MRNACLNLLLAGLFAAPVADADPELAEIPALNEYCLAAQRIVSRTEHPVELVIHDDFRAFVKSKAVIEGPQIQQFHWYEGGRVVGISCELKSADHLNLAFGDGTAGPDGLCQDMNRAVYTLVAQEIQSPVFDEIIFDAKETVMNDAQPGMTGPDWLKPYTATYIADNGKLHLRAKGFQVDFTDPRFEKAPARFRGVHYCHLVAPGYLRDLLAGRSKTGIVIGREVDTQGMPSATELKK